MLDKPWWEEHPDRLSHELRLLEEIGFPYKKDEEALKKGILRLHVEYEVEGKPLHLIVTFPDFYPRFRFEVMAPSLNLSRHQHPTGKNLCLIGRATHNWNTTDTLAFF